MNRSTFLVTLLAAGLVAACGGGGDASSANSTASETTAYALGPITGYGSIIVNGVHYDERNATVVDDDGTSRNRSELKMGVMVEVTASSDETTTAAGTTASARHIRFGSELLGPVASVAADARSFSLLDQTVLVSSTTVIDSSLLGGVAALAGKVVEVHAQFDAASGRYTATRIEAEDTPSAWRLRGVVSALDTTAKTFRIGSAVIQYANATELPAAGLANDMKVRVRLSTAQRTGPWTALSVRSGKRMSDDHASRAHLRGTVTSFTSATSFSVDGIAVDASNASFPDGRGFALGAWVKVKGGVSNGILIASEVEIDNRHADDDSRNPELNGSVISLDTTAKTFKLNGRDELIDYSGARFKDGSAASLANGVSVKVKGKLAADGMSVKATVVEFRS